MYMSGKACGERLRMCVEDKAEGCTCLDKA